MEKPFLAINPSAEQFLCRSPIPLSPQLRRTWGRAIQMYSNVDPCDLFPLSPVKVLVLSSSSHKSRDPFPGHWDFNAVVFDSPEHISHLSTPTVSRTNCDDHKYSKLQSWFRNIQDVVHGLR